MPRIVRSKFRYDTTINIGIPMFQKMALRELSLKYGTDMSALVRHAMTVALPAMYPGVWEEIEKRWRGWPVEHLHEINNAMLDAALEDDEVGYYSEEEWQRILDIIYQGYKVNEEENQYIRGELDEDK